MKSVFVICCAVMIFIGFLLLTYTLHNCYWWNRTIPSRLRRLLHPCTLSSLRIHIYFTHCLSSAHNDPPPHYCYRKSLVCYVYMYSSTAFATTVESEWQDLNLRPLEPRSSALPNWATFRYWVVWKKEGRKNEPEHKRHPSFMSLVHPVGLEPTWLYLKPMVFKTIL